MKSLDNNVRGTGVARLAAMGRDRGNNISGGNISLTVNGGGVINLGEDGEVTRDYYSAIYDSAGAVADSIHYEDGLISGRVEGAGSYSLDLRMVRREWSQYSFSVTTDSIQSIPFSRDQSLWPQLGMPTSSGLATIDTPQFREFFDMITDHLDRAHHLRSAF